MKRYCLGVCGLLEVMLVTSCGAAAVKATPTRPILSLLGLEQGAEDDTALAPGQTPVPDDFVLGHARTFERNIYGGLKDRTVKVGKDGTLTNDRFVTSTGDEVRAQEPLHTFVYSPDDPRFRETSLFVNANQMMDWFQNLGFDARGEQISIGVNAVINGSVNNALYIPAHDAVPPRIVVGNGDGRVLQNLSTDADVVSHLLGTHVVYRKLTVGTTETFLLHYALADIFVMLKNDDPCLGRSICGAEGGLCWIKNQCLRTADNNMKFDEVIDHLGFQSQSISGMLWDIKKSGRITRDELARLVFDSIEYLEEASTIEVFMKALEKSDRKNFGGRHIQFIRERAAARRIH